LGHRKQGAQVLDIAFREDDCRLRHIALNLLRREKTVKRSLKGKRMKAAWDKDYLLKVLTG